MPPPISIRGNADVSLQVLGSSVQLTGNVLPDGALNATVIEVHATVGVNVVRMGEITCSGPHKIRPMRYVAVGKDSSIATGAGWRPPSFTVSEHRRNRPRRTSCRNLELFPSES